MSSQPLDGSKRQGSTLEFMLSLLFVLVSPILFGMFLPIILGFWIDQDIAVFLFVIYAIVWIAVWHDPLDQGRKLEL